MVLVECKLQLNQRWNTRRVTANGQGLQRHFKPSFGSVHFWKWTKPPGQQLLLLRWKRIVDQDWKQKPVHSTSNNRLLLPVFFFFFFLTFNWLHLTPLPLFGSLNGPFAFTSTTVHLFGVQQSSLPRQPEQSGLSKEMNPRPLQEDQTFLDFCGGRRRE